MPWPLRNVWLKFLSLCIATMLWIIVAGDRVVERTVRVPIELQHLPAGLELVGDAPETVDVRVRASSGTIGRLGAGDTAAVLDLRAARPGRRLFHLTPAIVRVPYGIEVVQVAPATLPIGFEHSAVRIVQVRPSLEGRPAAGYEVAGVTARPATVEVIGPESSLRGLDEAMTEPISIADASRPLREVVTIGVADPAVRLREPQTAAVTVQIIAGASVRTIAGVVIEVRNWAGGGVVPPTVPPRVALTVRGTREDVSALTAGSFEVFVDAGSAGADREVAVRANAATGVTIDRVTPPSVRLPLEKP